MENIELSITNNDLASDLKSEYKIAFSEFDIDTALRKLDGDIHKRGIDKFDNELCNYIYSLADFMWRNGILTEEIKNKAISMIDSNFGMELFYEAGDDVLSKRVEILQKFKNKLLTDQPPKKKIKNDLYTKPIFENGDMLALKLKTIDKSYKGTKNISEKRFKELDGKYVVIRKVGECISFVSSIDPSIKDIWPNFELFKTVYDEIPSLDEILRNRKSVLVAMEGSIKAFEKANYVYIGNSRKGMKKCNEDILKIIFLNRNRKLFNTESMIIDYIE